MTIQTLLTMALVLAPATGLAAHPPGYRTTKDTCEAVMNRNGLNFSTFPKGAAHGVHSIYLEEIRHFFEPEAPANNKIPVISTNLSAEQMILFDSPLAGYGKNFNTLPLQVMAFFMLNDSPNFYQQGSNTFEKISHQYHMHEIYTAAAPIYQGIKAHPPTDPKLCPCVNDIAVNGILTKMHNMANKLKNFARTPLAEKCPTDMNKPEPKPNYKKTTRCRPMSTPDSNTNPVSIAQYKEEYLKEPSRQNANKVLSIDPWTPNTLAGPEQWISFEAVLTYSMLVEEELNDFATFIYCKLNEPELDILGMDENKYNYTNILTM